MWPRCSQCHGRCAEEAGCWLRIPMPTMGKKVAFRTTVEDERNWVCDDFRPWAPLNLEPWPLNKSQWCGQVDPNPHLCSMVCRRKHRWLQITFSSTASYSMLRTQNYPNYSNYPFFSPSRTLTQLYTSYLISISWTNFCKWDHIHYFSSAPHNFFLGVLLQPCNSSLSNQSFTPPVAGPRKFQMQ